MPNYNSLVAIKKALRNEELTCSQLVEYYLRKIQATDDLNAYIEVFEEKAIARAIELDAKFKSKPDTCGRLFGMVVSIKDVLCYKDHKVTAASKILENFSSLYTATAVQRLLDEDAIIIGRVNCDQFAMGSSNENSIYGPVKNALNKEKVPGGSSGGSAVAVQTDTCLASIGSDTGGSVRQPAAFCGIIGMKPTYGRISRYGLLAYASSFDQIGVLTRSVSDAALLIEVMAGPDEFDATVSHNPPSYYSKKLEFDGKAKIAYFDTALNHSSIDPEIKKSSTTLIENLKADGHTVEAVDFEYLDYIIPAYYVLTTAEASSNLSRFDGIRFGYRSEKVTSLEDTYKKSRTEGFSEEVKKRIMLGTFVLSSGYYDAYYTKAQKVRRLIKERTEEILKKYDFILMPTSPAPAWNIGEMADDPVQMYLADIFTVQANMAGIPAISLPLATHSNGMPFGVQLMASQFQESLLFSFSQYLMENIIEKEKV